MIKVVNLNKLIWIDQIRFILVFKKNILNFILVKLCFLMIVQIIFKIVKVTGS